MKLRFNLGLSLIDAKAKKRKNTLKQNLRCCPNVEKPIEQMIKHRQSLYRTQDGVPKMRNKMNNKLTLNLGWCRIDAKAEEETIKVRTQVTS